LATTAVVAQRGGGGVARGGASTGSQPTPLEQLSNRLDLDKKTQVPVVEQIVTDAARAALPVAQEMTQLRRRLLDMEVTGMSADTHPVLDAHAVAAAKMARMEAQAYRDIFATLKPKQQSKTPEAFALMAGILQPATPMAGRAGRGGGGALFEVSAAPVQRGGGGGGSRGGGGFGGGATQPSRLDLLTRAFTLDKTQVKQVKQILDDAYKGAASVCDQLKVTHAAIGAAIQAGKTPADLDELVKAYAVPATAMTRVEMQALAHMLLALSDSQRANTGATDTAFLLARAMFLDDKKWDMAPNGRNY
jgi:hypothetical protein